MSMKRLCRFGLLACILLAGQVGAKTCNLKDYGTLPVDMLNGKPTTMVKINGTDTRFMLDTGAQFSIMSKATASSLGLRPHALPDDFRMSGIGGSSDVQYARVNDFGLLGTTLKNITFLVGGSDAGYGIIGANVLDVADLELDLAHGKVTLFATEGCGDAPLAYWAKGTDYNVADIEPQDNNYDQRTILYIVINGKKLRAVLDSGAYATMLTRDAAERIGIDLSSPDVKASFVSHGVGSKTIKSWTVNLDAFTIGTETIHHTQVQVLDGYFGDRETDMLLGVDFLLAHHMYVANRQHKAYFTYNGGRVFTLANAPGDGEQTGTGGSGDDKDTTLKSASDYALAGEAHLSRGENQAAVADLDKAISLAPDQAGYYFARARAHAANQQPDAMLADLDKSLSLDPKNVDALLMRAEVHHAHNDPAAAMADVAAATPLASAGSEQARAIASLDIQLEQPAAALPLLDDWIRLHASDAMLGSALEERCWARALTNQLLDDALKDCRKAIKRDGEKPGYLNSLGLVQLRLGNYPEAIKAYQQAIALQPRYGWAHYGLGLAEIRSGQKDAGNAELATARAINPKIQARAEKYGLTAATP
jgi:predicted aspartyl protease/tetratricopeptide (TPR) repeat protein